MPHTDFVALLNADDTLLHVGRRAEVIPHLQVTPETVDDFNKRIEFYDSKGARLVLTAADGTVTFTERKKGGKRRAQLVADRIVLVFARHQVELTRKPDPLFAYRLPVMSAPLPITLAAAAEVFGPLHDPILGGGAPPNADDDYHTYCHKKGIAH